MAEKFQTQKEVRLHGSAQRVIKNGTKIKLIPQKKFTDMLDAIKLYLETDETVNKAYFRVMIRNDTDSSYLVVVDLTKDADKDATFDGIVAVKPFPSGCIHRYDCYRCRTRQKRFRAYRTIL